MALYVNGFKTITHIGTPDATVGSQRKLHSYVTNDDKAAVETANYFLALYSRLSVGDQIQMSLNLGVSPMLRCYIVTVSNSTTVTISPQNVA